MATTLQNSKMKFWIFIVGLLCVCSCEKEKESICESRKPLSGDMKILSGEWDWKYSVKISIDKGNGQVIKDTIYKNEIDTSYTLGFLASGDFYYAKNNTKSLLHCITVNRVVRETSVSPNLLRFFLYFESVSSSDDFVIYHTESTDTIQCISNRLSLPFKNYETEEFQFSYSNHFEKIE